MGEDDSNGQDGGFQPLVAALRRAKREVGHAVERAADGIENWVGEQWFPTQLVMAGGFSWVLSQAFGWLLDEVVEFSNWFVASLLRISASVPSGRILFVFFVVYVIHSLGQTKVILGIKTTIERMDSEIQSDVRTDGGGDEEFTYRGGAIGGILIGITIGSAFGMDGGFVGAGVGWVLGKELDNRLEAKVNEAGYSRREGQGRVEKQ